MFSINQLIDNSMNNSDYTCVKKEKYVDWVNRVVEFLENTAPYIGEGGRACSVMQSRPVLEKEVDVVFLGCNADEDYGFCGIDYDRFMKGNKYFYNNEYHQNNDAMLYNPWRIWYKPYYALSKALNDSTPMEDGHYVFMNAIYFGTKTLQQMDQLPKFSDVKNICLDFTREVIIEIFKPKLIVCFSVNNCFDVLNTKYGFSNTETTKPHHPYIDYNCSKSVKSATWNGIRVIGIPHPSGRISNDDWGCIGKYILQNYHDVCK